MNWVLIFLGTFFFLMLASKALNLYTLIPKEKLNLNLLFAILSMMFTGIVYIFKG